MPGQQKNDRIKQYTAYPIMRLRPIRSKGLTKGKVSFFETQSSGGAVYLIVGNLGQCKRIEVKAVFTFFVVGC